MTATTSTQTLCCGKARRQFDSGLPSGQGSLMIQPLPCEIVVFFDFGGQGLQRLLDIHNHRTDLGVRHSLLSFVFRHWREGVKRSREGEEEGGGERRWRRSRHTSHRCAQEFLCRPRSMRVTPCLRLGLFSRRPFDSGGSRPIPTDPFGCGLCRLADTWVLRDPS